MSIDHDSAQAQKLKDICTESATGVPGLFEGAAAYYARYRPKYPMAMFDRLVDRFDLGTLSSVLDLGCGTGQLALPLLKCPLFSKVEMSPFEVRAFLFFEKKKLVA